MNQTRRVFTTEFKQECVCLFIDQGYGDKQAVKALLKFFTIIVI
jgi:transposase-like protein